MNEKDIIADVVKEGQPFDLDTKEVKAATAKDSKVETTTPESQTEKKQEGAEVKEGEVKVPSEAKEEPFHKNPRWNAMRKRNEALEQELSDFRKWKEEVDPLLKNISSSKSELPEWWKKAYGEEETSKKAYEDYLKNSDEYKQSIKREILDEIKATTESQTRARQEANSYVEESIEALKAEKGDFDKNELFKFMLDFEKEFFPIVDEKGNYDFTKGYQLWKQMNPVSDSTEAKKKIAADTMKSKVSVSNSNIPVVSPKMLRRGASWRDAV